MLFRDWLPRMGRWTIRGVRQGARDSLREEYRGTFNILLGASSRDIRLTTAVTL